MGSIFSLYHPKTFTASLILHTGPLNTEQLFPFPALMFLSSPLLSHLVLLSSSICRGQSVLAAPTRVPLIPAGGHLLGRPLSEHLVQVEPAPVAHKERADLEGRTGGRHQG